MSAADHVRAKQHRDAPGERARHDFLRRVPHGAAQIPVALYERARSHRASMLARIHPDDAVRKGESASTWEDLGPGNIGGRTRAFLIDPDRPTRLYAAGVSGGVWRSLNEGASWQLLSDVFTNVNVSTLALDPSNPDTLYAGTGEVWLNAERPYSRLRGHGIYKSEDGGDTWAPLAATSTPDFRFVTKLAVSPDDGRRVWAATVTGLWTSADGGLTWSAALQPTDANGDVVNNGCNDIEFRPDDANTIYVTCGSRSRNDRYHVDSIFEYVCPGDCEGRAYRNVDASGNGDWELVLSEAGMGRVELAVSPADPDVVYALGASLVPAFDRDGDGEGDYTNGLHAVFRSNDAGVSWMAQVRTGGLTQRAKT